MSVLKEVLIEELDRIKKNIDSHESLLLSLPRGYLFEQTINGKPYCYRKHREGSEIVSEYIGASESDEAKKAHADYQERKRIENNLRVLRKEEDKLAEVNWESTHQHLFSNYIDYNDSSHQAFCNCGDYKLEGHTLVLSPDPLNPYITGHKCIKCNRRFP